MVDEWTARGGEDTTREKIMEFAPQAAHPAYAAKIPMPPWLGNPDLHLSHRSRLIAKDPRFYSPVFPGTDPDLEYVWPAPKHLLLPEDPSGDRLWVLRLPLGDIEPEQLKTISLPPAGRAKALPRTTNTSSSTPTRAPAARQGAQASSQAARQEAHQQTPAAGRGLHHTARQLRRGHPGRGRRFLRRGQGPGPAHHGGRPFARNFQVDEVLDRSAFDYPALLQDPRMFFPVPAP